MYGTTSLPIALMFASLLGVNSGPSHPYNVAKQRRMPYGGSKPEVDRFNQENDERRQKRKSARSARKKNR